MYPIPSGRYLRLVVTGRIQFSSNLLLQESFGSCAIRGTLGGDNFPSQAIDVLGSLQSQPIIAAAPQSVRNEFMAVRELVQNLSRHIGPDMDTGSLGEWWLSILDKCQWFFTDAAAENPDERREKVALQKAWARMIGQTAKGHPPQTLEELQGFQAFKWLLTESQKGSLAKAVSDVLQVHVVASAVSQPAAKRQKMGTSSGSLWVHVLGSGSYPLGTPMPSIAIPPFHAQGSATKASSSEGVDVMSLARSHPA